LGVTGCENIFCPRFFALRSFAPVEIEEKTNNQVRHAAALHVAIPLAAVLA
jgi:hypothetical protein